MMTNQSNFIDEAIYKLYPNVKTIIGSKDCYDAKNNLVEVDWTLVNAECVNLQYQYNLKSCKTQASALLYETDWTTIPDVANPENSPYLANQADFIAYRNEVRKLAVVPVENPVFPTKPQEVWA